MKGMDRHILLWIMTKISYLTTCVNCAHYLQIK